MTETQTPVDSPNSWVADHIRRYVETAGREGHLWYGPKGNLEKGVPTLLLTTVGRRSGQPRRTALIYGPVDDDKVGAGADRYAVVASYGGAPDHPLWYYNLLAKPEVTVQVEGDVFAARARTATDSERARLWPRLVEIWPPYDDYQAKTERIIPVVILERA